MVEVRRGTTGDLDELLVLVAEYCEADHHTFDPAIARSGLQPLLDSDRVGVVWVACGDTGRLTGYAAVTWNWSIEIGGFEVVLDEVYVADRGRGIGSALLDAVETDCRDRGARRIFLETEAPNTAARRLYARHGFATETSIWMSKRLSGS